MNCRDWCWAQGALLLPSWLFSLLWWCWVHSYELLFPPCQGWYKTLPQVLGCHSSGLLFSSARSPTPGLDLQAGLLSLVGQEQAEPAHGELSTGPRQH